MPPSEKITPVASPPVSFVAIARRVRGSYGFVKSGSTRKFTCAKVNTDPLRFATVYIFCRIIKIAWFRQLEPYLRYGRGVRQQTPPPSRIG